jgi:hypothetical protein
MMTIHSGFENYRTNIPENFRYHNHFNQPKRFLRSPLPLSPAGAIMAESNIQALGIFGRRGCFLSAE